MKSWKNLLVGAAVIGASVMLVGCSSNGKSTSDAKKMVQLICRAKKVI
ncbi:hypothetical protein ACGO3R_08335 [Lactococcus lactis]